MQKTILKRALSLLVCLAVLIAGMPLAVLTATAETPANVVVDDFESGEVKWIRDDSTEIDAERIVAQSTTNTNKVFNPLFKEGTSIGSVGAYTYAGKTPDTKLVSVSGRFNAPSGHSLVLIYYYKDASNWRGVSIGGGGQWLRFVGREIQEDLTAAKHDFITYDSYASHGGTFTSNYGLYGASIVDFTITYAEDGTASMVLSRTVNGVEEVSTAIPLFTSATTKDGIKFSKVNAREGKFAFGNAMNNGTWVDNIVMTYEKTSEQAAEDFKTTHAAILAKTVGTVTADDKAAITAASADYDALSDGAKALLEDEYKLLGQLEDAIVAGEFNVSSFTDDFSGENYWTQVGDGAVATINNAQFTPGAPTDASNGKPSIHTHKYWPNRTVKEVTGTLQSVGGNGGATVIYYYKDKNNWRGFYLQAGGSTTHLRYVMKASDPSDSKKVYYNYATANVDWNIINNPKSGTRVNFKIEYLSNTQIKVTISAIDSNDAETIKLYDNLAVAKSFGTVATSRVSTDGGVTFGAAEAIYTFPAITDAKSSQFAIGRCLGSGTVDDITVSFEEAPQDLADKFLEKYAELLAKDEASVTMADKETIFAAIAEYGTLTADAQALLADEYALLTAMSEALYAGTMDGESYTETFEDDYLWKCDGTPANKVITELADGNKVFTPGGVGSTSAPVVYTHKYWQDKVLSSVTGKMYISDRSLSSTYPSNVIVYNYKDADNWRGVYFTNILTDTGDLFSQPVKFIGKENGVNKTYYYYSLGNKEFSIENRVTTFTITYNENGTASLVLTNDTGTSSTIDLINDCVGGYVERVNNNYGAFGVASVTGASADDWFDDITFNFGDTFEQKAETFKATYADTLALDLETVTNDNKLEIAALYDAYNKITRNDKMATLLSAEGAKVDALIEAVKAYNKNTTDAIRIAFVGDSNTESGNMNGGPLAEVGYPYMVQQELNRMYGEGKFVVGNFGISGKTAREYYQFVYDGNGNYLNRGMLESLFFDPDIVVLCLGGNDALYSTDEAFEYYYKKLADEYVALVGEENFIATAPIHHYHSIENNCPKRREAIKTMADANGWSFFNLYADTYDFLINNRDVYDSVGLHPVQAYDVLANAAVNYLDKNILGQYDLDKIVSEEFEEFEETFTIPETEVSADNLADIDAALELFETLTPEQQANYAEEKAALEQIKVVATFDKEVKNTVVTPANVSIIAEKQAAYDALGVDNAAIEESIANLQETVDSFSSQVLGCSIKTDADPTKQDLRYEYEAPQWDAPEGWYVKEYGAIFYPAAALGNNPLTLETPKIAKGAGELNPDGSVPSTFRANLVGSALKSINCSMDIAGTAYVIWTDGTNEYVCYSNNTVDNSGYTENNVVNGVGVRSVYKTARKIAAAIYGTTEYGTVNYTEKVTEGGDLATFANADILEFVSKNIDAITNYVGKNQGE